MATGKRVSIWQDKDGYWHVTVNRDGQRIPKRCRKGAPKTQAMAYSGQVV